MTRKRSRRTWAQGGRLGSRPHPRPRGVGSTLELLAADHLARKRAVHDASTRWLGCVERHLEECVTYFGPDTPIQAIDVRAVEDYVAHLLQRPNRRGGCLSPATVNHYLNSLSNLFRRARADGRLQENPVAALLSRPRPEHPERWWLERDEVADVLRAARAYRARRTDRALPFLYELVAVFAYTGLRTEEALGLDRIDVDLARGLLHIRPNQWRGIKTSAGQRTLPIFPELHEVLTLYLDGARRPGGSLLFPAPGGERPVRNLRRVFDTLPVPERLQALARAAGSSARVVIRPRLLRHAYCAARLQTLDRGAPISPYTVARELGHRDETMVRRIYAHLGTQTFREEVVSYRVDPPGLV